MKTLPAKILAIFCLCILSFACQQQSKVETEINTAGQKFIANETAKKIDALMQQHHMDAKYNGTILVADDGEVIYKAAFGIANIEAKIPMELSSQFYIASVAKQMTCMGIMILTEEGKLTYDDKISTFFPDLPDWADEVSVRNMMNHTSGIPDYYEMNVPRPGFTNDDVYEALLKVDTLDFPVGSDYSYSNSAYVLLSMIITEASGLSFGEFMEQKIFQPLEMGNSLVYDQSVPEMPKRAIGYTLDLKKDDYQFFTTGGGGIFSNIEDIFKWDQALYTDVLISQESLKEAYRPVKLTNDSLSYYGFGWRLDKEDPNIVQHSGSLNGFRTYIRRELDRKHTIILLTNHSNSWLSDIQEEIAQVLNN